VAHSTAKKRVQQSCNASNQYARMCPSLVCAKVCQENFSIGEVHTQCILRRHGCRGERCEHHSFTGLEIFEESLVEKDWLEMGVTSGENREYLEKLKSENWRRFDAARAKFEGEPRKFLNHLSENFESYCHRRPEGPLNIWRKISRKE